jgi:hypothetical protein
MRDLVAEMRERDVLMNQLGELGFNQKLALYKTAREKLGNSYVAIRECVIYEDRYGKKFPLLKCEQQGETYWFREEELTNFVL